MKQTIVIGILCVMVGLLIGLAFRPDTTAAQGMQLQPSVTRLSDNTFVLMRGDGIAAVYSLQIVDAKLGRVAPVQIGPALNPPH